MISATVEALDMFDKLLAKYEFWKFLRVTSWIFRFLNNCRRSKQSGPLTTSEIEQRKKFSINREQHRVQHSEKFKINEKRLDLQQNSEGIYVCKGRIEHVYPIYLPNESLLSEKIIFAAHKNTLHGGVLMTMTTFLKATHEIYHPQLLRLQATCSTLSTTKIRTITKRHVRSSHALQVIGTDYAGPIYYCTKSKKESKAYILFSCSLSRAVHLQLTPNLTANEFIKCFKRLIARRGRPKTVYSDNAKIFQAAAKWLKQVIKTEQNIKWKFNLPQAPWLGGHFERLIGLTKQSLFKSLGKTRLSWNELESVLLDVEVNLNNRPLIYIEDDIQYPIVTPNSMLLARDTVMLEKDPEEEDDKNSWNKRKKYIVKMQHGGNGRGST